MPPAATTVTRAGLVAPHLTSPAARLAAFAAGQALLVALGHQLALSDGALFAFWPAAGLLLGALLTAGPGGWPWVIGAALLSEGLVTAALQPIGWPKLLYGTCELAEALVAAWVVRRRIGRSPRLGSVRQVLDLLGGVAVGCAAGATLEVLLLQAVYPPSRPWAEWSGWFVGDALGMLVFAPAVLAWLPPWSRPAPAPAPAAGRRGLRVVEAATLAAALVAAAILTFGGEGGGVRIDRGYLILPVLGWAALRLGLRGMTAAGVGLSLAAAASSWHGALHGSQDRAAGTSLQVQLLLAVSVGAALLLAVLLEERTRAERRAEAAERLASVGALAAGMAHEINNPLTYLAAGVEHAREVLETRRGDGAVDSALDALGDAAEGALRIGRVVRDLKLVSRVEPGERSAVALQDEIGSAVKLTAHEVRHRARLVLDLGPAPLVEAPRFQLGQVFVNLLVNAAHAMPEGRADANQIRITTRTGAGGEAVAEVRDTGCGMPEAVRARVFEPFFTTKPLGQGTGLGLSVCHGIVAALGGRLEVESEEGRGSTFRLTLPPAPAAALAAPPLAAAPAPHPRARVLVVDDEPLVGLAIQRALREVEVEASTDGRAALQRLVDGERFDLVLCDLMMPNLSGMELYEALEARAPAQAARVVFITAGAFTPRARAFLERTRRPHLAKPFEGEALRAAVAGLLDAGPVTPTGA